MKKISRFNEFKHLGMAVLLTAAMTACSNSDDSIEPQPDNAPKAVMLTVEAVKDGEAATRALGFDGTKLVATWGAGEKVDVYNSSNTKIGTLTPTTTGSKSTTLTGLLSSAVSLGDELKLCYKKVPFNYTGQNGKLTGTGSIAANYDYAYTTVTVTDVTTTNATTTAANFVNQQAIVKFTLWQTDGATPINAKKLNIHAVDNELRYWYSPMTYTMCSDIKLTCDGTTNEIYAAILYDGTGTTWTLTAEDATNVYTFTTPTSYKFDKGKYYTVGVKMTGIYPKARTSVTASDDLGRIIADDGQVYASIAGATAAGKTAAAVIAYVGSASDCTNGLAIAPSDESGTMNFATAQTTAAAHTPAITGCTWRLPTLLDWQYMFTCVGYGTPSATSPFFTEYWGLKNVLVNIAGATALTKLTDYWTNNGDASNAYTLIVDNEEAYAPFQQKGVENTFNVRAVLAF